MRARPIMAFWTNYALAIDNPTDRAVTDIDEQEIASVTHPAQIAIGAEKAVVPGFGDHVAWRIIAVNHAG